MRRMVLTEQKSCEKCSSDVNCSSSGKCWCFEYDSAKNIESLDLKYSDCVCEMCLTEAED